METKTVNLGTGIIEKIMQVSKAFTATDDSRPILKHILLEIKKDKIRAVACDGWKLSVFDVEYNNPEQEEFNCYIKPFTLPKNIISTDILVDDKKTYITFNLSDGSSITYSNISIVGDYIDYKNVIPEVKQEMSISFNANYLSKVVSAVKDFNGNVKMYFCGDGKIDKVKPALFKSKITGVGEITSILLPVRCVGDE